MIRSEWLGKARWLDHLFFEACLDHFGEYQHQWATLVLARHEKDSARTMRVYRTEINPGACMQQGHKVVATEKFTRVMLRPEVDAGEVLQAICTLTGSPEIDHERAL